MAMSRLASFGIAVFAGAALLAGSFASALADDQRGAGGGGAGEAEQERPAPAPHRRGGPGAADARPGAGSGGGTTEPEGPAAGERGGARAPAPRRDDGCPYRGRQLELIV